MYFVWNFQFQQRHISFFNPGMNRLLRIGLFLLILFTGFALLGIYWTFYKPLPNYSGTMELEGLQQPVDVHWDPYGVPYIHAQNDDDLYFTLGYLHAQERIWQMTLSQLSAEGRFAEFLGEDLVELDKYQRTLGFWETAQQILEESDPEIIRILERYADGVNHYTEAHRRDLPVEFSLLDAEPIEWTPAHSIALTRLMAWDQNIHWWSELAFGWLDQILEPHRLQELFPVYRDHYPTTLSDAQSRTIAEGLMPVIDKEMQRRSILSMDGLQFGSNAWAVQGRKTDSGYPILAGDPHMGLSIPGFWFETHFSTPSQRVTGATIPGLPFVILGQNDDIAWTITNMMADVVDFFIELPDPADADRYIRDSTATPVQSEPFRFRDEIIQVKGGDDQLFRVRHTENGPVISDILDNPMLDGQAVVSMSWTGHRVSHEIFAGHRINQASGPEEFEEAVREFKSPAMMFTYADRFDNIGLFSAADIPVRNHHPLLFRQGWDPDYRWQQSVPYAELPRVFNPQSGFVAHANNKLHTDSYRHYIGSFWAPPSRIMRITDLLENDDEITTESTRRLQFDYFSEHASEITEQILPMLRSGGGDREFETVLAYLENWDFYYHPTSSAATIFDLFFLNLTRNALLDDLGEDAFNALTSLNYVPVQIISRMLDENSVFFSPDGLPQEDHRDKLVQESMRQTISQLQEEFGEDPINWRWENANTLTLRPPLLGDAAMDENSPAILRMIVNNLFNRGPYPVHGNGMSVNKAESGWDRPFDVRVGASIRRIVDFSTPGRSLSVLPTGQSGNPISTHYGDQTDLWIDGRYRYIYHDDTFFQQASYQTMTLQPR
jgi:penicillin G amidase